MRTKQADIVDEILKTKGTADNIVFDLNPCKKTPHMSIKKNKTAYRQVTLAKMNNKNTKKNHRIITQDLTIPSNVKNRINSKTRYKGYKQH